MHAAPRFEILVPAHELGVIHDCAHTLTEISEVPKRSPKGAPRSLSSLTGSRLEIPEFPHRLAEIPELTEKI